MNKILRIILISFFLITSSACKSNPAIHPPPQYPYAGSDNPIPIGSTFPYPNNTTQILPTGYPGPNSAYPQPQPEPILMATSGPIPTPDENSGIVTGILLVNGEPVIDVNIYLADLVKDDQGNDLLASYGRANSPRAFTDGEGRFVFANIAPKKYGLILDVVLSSYLLSHPSGSGPIFILVEAGKVVNLGKLDYSELPLP
jgi:hypothetical protein